MYIVNMVKDSAERGIVFSKKLVHTYWYFVISHLTVSLYSKNCKWRLSLTAHNWQNEKNIPDIPAITIIGMKQLV